MRKSLIALIGTLALGGVALWFVSSPRGVSIGGVDFGGAERRWLAERTADFLEDLQFKDFDTASKYHLAADREKRDIPAMIQSRFGIKHEVLDITRYEILEVDLDRAKTRARVRSLVHFHVLGDKLVRDDKESSRDVEMLLYWFRDAAGQWTMELSSSL